MRNLTHFFVVLLLSCLGAGSANMNPAKVAASPQPAPLNLESGLDDHQRRDFYSLPEGSEVFPRKWADALLSSKTNQRFTTNLERFGLIRDDRAANGYIGYTSADRGDITGVPMIGFNCAACHVGQIHYQGNEILIDGAPNMFDIFGLNVELQHSLRDTLSEPARLLAFFESAYGPEAIAKLGNDSEAARINFLSRLRDKVFEDILQKHTAAILQRGGRIPNPPVMTTTEERTTFVLSLLGSTDIDARFLIPIGSQPERQISMENAEELRRIDDPLETEADFERNIAVLWSYARILAIRPRLDDPLHTKPLFGRADATGLARTLFFNDHQPLTAPTSFPHIWGFEKFRWLHWSANTNSVVQRNLGQALALGAGWDDKTCATTVNFLNLEQLEKIGYKITAPRWPENSFGRIDIAKRDRGEQLYMENCRNCHNNFTESMQPGESAPFRDFALFSVEKIGTDKNAALNVSKRVMVNKTVCSGQDDTQSQTFAEGHEILLGAIEKAYYERTGADPSRIAQFRSGRAEDDWEDRASTTADPVYAAKPLDGVWATAPYLHNGSVRTLWELLSPNERPQTFHVGSRVYDVERVGYIDDGPEIFNTDLSGNSRTGHDDRAIGLRRPLTAEEKWALIEYLKSL